MKFGKKKFAKNIIKKIAVWSKMKERRKRRKNKKEKERMTEWIRTKKWKIRKSINEWKESKNESSRKNKLINLISKKKILQRNVYGTLLYTEQHLKLKKMLSINFQRHMTLEMFFWDS